MAIMITSGMVLIQSGTALPRPGLPPDSPYSSNWRVLAGPRASIEGGLRDAGWTWFYMAGEIRTRAFGFDSDKRLQVALRRALRQVESEHCNCIEITSITIKSFMGMPYSTIAAHARHIQNGTCFRER